MVIGIFKEKLEIKEGSRLAGYPNTETRFCRGKKGDIEVNGIILKKDKNIGCIISIDVIGTPLSLTNKIRKRIEKQFSIPFDNIMISATHTHSSGITTGRNWKVDEEFITEIETKIIKGIENGYNNFEEVKIKWLTTKVDISHNRRVVINGKVINEWQDKERKHIGIVDREVIVLGFFRKNESLKSMIINYACHPVVLGPSNFYASADYVGYMRNFLIDKIILENIVFLQGASGNINPRDCITDNFEIAKKTGETIGEEILKSLNNFKEIGVTDFNFERKRVEFVKKDDTGTLPTEIQILKIGSEILIITLPGEPIVEIGLELKKKSKYPVTIIAGYTNDYIGYIANDQILMEGAHEANSCPVKNVEETIKKELSEYLNDKY